MTTRATAYRDTQLLIGGEWRAARSGADLPVLNPATDTEIGRLARAGEEDLAEAVSAAAEGFAVWRKTSAYDRARIMREAARLLRERARDIAVLMTLEQGKPIAQAEVEVIGAADTIEWFAEEGRRAGGWVIPARSDDVRVLAIKEPIGPVAAFTPWNFPINQIVRKLSAALAAGCSIIVKAPEETPASPAELIRAFVDAGVPAGVIGLVYGDPAEISQYLIAHPVIRKVTFTGSTAVGKHLAALAGSHMKPATMELGGHAPALVFDDYPADQAAAALAASKFRNAGQVCISPTRFLVQDMVHDAFVDNFVRHAINLKVGDGLDPATTMGPLANKRRIGALEELIADALDKGASLATGGRRIGNHGYFFEPTVLTDVTPEMRICNEEPFGPVALMIRFSTEADAVNEANRLPFGLAAYAFTTSAARTQRLLDGIEAGMITMNHINLGLPEYPFGGIKDSGYGSEGGQEAIHAYLNTKMTSVKSDL
ncbi:NAD-dependent succinate-semialdehyde dehydrogenase [Sphingobium fuliginis]|uniref:NAD-dependent succinate-semialdehyde dehydrogenase n=1 Tax=Sphingobium fuliginis ATCC 27551 TaxID=1208342 RepID=A0A5B8CME0_SPHSA|nr:NAD-dependent succinate-semialdehyde dehydrogenase [Sphingobium fuliginis]QDC39631.1 NAD-dependent succinate-semialdehyde dehydrogenase [Sphingobium fuliginis ATCC 27551]